MDTERSTFNERVSKINKFQNEIEKTGFIALLGLGCTFAISPSLASICSVIIFLAFVVTNKFRLALEHFKKNPVFLLAGILFILLACGMFYTSAPLKEAFWTLKKYRDLIFILILASFIKTDRHRELMITAFSGGMLLTVIGATVDWLGWLDFITKQKVIARFLFRASSNSFVVFFAFLALHKFQHSNTRKHKIGWLLGALGAGFYVYVIAISRTAYILGILLIFLWTYQKFKLKGLLYGLVSVVILVSIIWPFSNVFQKRMGEAVIHARDYFVSRPSRNFKPTQLRIGWYTHSFKIFIKKPILGHGTGAMLTEYKRHFPDQREFIIDNAHNSYLLLGVQVGAVGMLLYVTLLLYQLRMAGFLSEINKSLAQGFILVQGIGSLANSYLLSTDTGLFYCYFTVLLYTGLKYKTARNRAPVQG